jgi:hypothetical protein
VAAVGLVLAGYELRAGCAERRDNDASQARLVTIERQVTDDPLFFSFGVHNHSEAPVFDLSLDRIGYIELRDDGKMVPLYPAASSQATTRGRGSTLGFATQRELAEPVLGPDAEVWVGYEWHDEEWFKSFRDLETLKAQADCGVTISFLDSNGRRWQRTNTAAPMRLISPSELPLWHWRRWRG